MAKKKKRWEYERELVERVLDLMERNAGVVQQADDWRRFYEDSCNEQKRGFQKFVIREYYWNIPFYGSKEQVEKYLEERFTLTWAKKYSDLMSWGSEELVNMAKETLLNEWIEKHEVEA